MSFSRAKFRRFNEEIGCAPAVGHYDPKYLVKNTTIVLEKSQRFKETTHYDQGSSTDLDGTRIKINQTISQKTSFRSSAKKFSHSKQARSFSCSNVQLPDIKGQIDTAYIEQLKKQFQEQEIIIRNLEEQVRSLTEQVRPSLTEETDEKPSPSNDQGLLSVSYAAPACSLLDYLCLSPFRKKTSKSPEKRTNAKFHSSDGKSAVSTSGVKSNLLKWRDFLGNTLTSSLPAASTIVVNGPQFASCQKENLELSQENEEVIQSKQSALKRLSIADDEIFELQQNTQDQQRQLDMKTEECIALNERLSALCFELESVKRSLNYRETQCAIRENKLGELKEYNNNLEQQLEEVKQKMNEQIDKLSSKLEQEVMNAETKEKEMAELTLRVCNLTTTKNELELKYEDHVIKTNQEFEELGCQLKFTEEELKNAKELTDELKKLNNERSEEIKVMSLKSEDHNVKAIQKIEKLEGQLIFTEGELKDAKEFSANVERLNSVLSEKNKEMELKFEGHVLKFNEEIEMISSQLKTAEEELKVVKTSAGELEKRNFELVHQNKEIGNQKQLEIEALLVELQAFSAEMEEQKATNNNLATDLSIMGLKVIEMNQEKCKLEMENSNLEAVKSSLNYRETQCEILDNKLGQLNEYNADLQQQLDEVKREKDEQIGKLSFKLKQEVLIVEKKEKEMEELALSVCDLAMTKNELELKLEEHAFKNNQEFEELCGQLKITEEELKNAKELTDGLRKSNSELAEKYKEMELKFEDRILKSIEEVQMISCQLEAAEEEADELEMRNFHLADQNKEIVSQKQLEIEGLLAQLQALDRKMVKLKATNNILETELSTMSLNVYELNQEKCKLEMENSDLEAVKRSLNYRITQCEILDHKLGELNEYNADLEQQLKEVKQERDQQIGELSFKLEQEVLIVERKEKEIEELTLRVCDLTMTKNELELKFEDHAFKTNQESEELGCQLKFTGVELKNAKKLTDELKKANEEMRLELEDNIVKSTQEVEKLDSQLKCIEGELKDAKEFAANIEELNSVLSKKNKEMELNFEDCILKSTKEAEMISLQLKTAEEELKVVQTRASELEMHNCELVDQNSEMVSQKQLETETLLVQLRASSTEIEELKAINNILEPELSKMSLKVTELNQDKRILEMENSNLESKLEHSLAQNATKDVFCQERNVEIRELVIFRDRLTSENDLLVKQVDEHRTELTELLNTKQTLQNEVKISQNNISKLEKQLAEFARTCEQTNSELLLRENEAKTFSEINERQENELKLQELFIQQLIEEKDSLVQRLLDEQAKNQDEESFKKKYEDLEESILPFKDLLDDFAREKALLVNLKDEALSELSELSNKIAKQLGHQNQRQRIQYLEQLQGKYNNLKIDHQKQREIIDKQQKELQSFQRLQSEVTPRKFIKTPAKAPHLPAPVPSSQILKAKENLNKAFF